MIIFPALFALSTGVVVLNGKEYRGQSVAAALEGANATLADFSNLDGDDVKNIPASFITKATPYQLDKIKLFGAYLPLAAKSELVKLTRANPSKQQVGKSTAKAPASSKAKAGKAIVTDKAGGTKNAPLKKTTSNKTTVPAFRQSIPEFLKMDLQTHQNEISPKEITKVFDLHPYSKVPLAPWSKKHSPSRRDPINLMTDRAIAIDSLFKWGVQGRNHYTLVGIRHSNLHRSFGWGYLKGKHPISGICPRNHKLLLDWALIGVVLSVGLRKHSPSCNLGTWLKCLDIRFTRKHMHKLSTSLKHLKTCKKANEKLWNSMVEYSLKRVKESPGMANFDPYNQLPRWVTGVDPVNEADEEIPVEALPVADDAPVKKQLSDLKKTRQARGWAPSLDKRIQPLLLFKPDMKGFPKAGHAPRKKYNFLLHDPPRIFASFEKWKDGFWKSIDLYDKIAEHVFNWLRGVRRLPNLPQDETDLLTEWAMIVLVFDNNVPNPLGRFASWISQLPSQFMSPRQTKSRNQSSPLSAIPLIKLAKSRNQRIWKALLEFSEEHIRADPDYVPLPLLEAWSERRRGKASAAQEGEITEVDAENFAEEGDEVYGDEISNNYDDEAESDEDEDSGDEYDHSDWEGSESEETLAESSNTTTTTTTVTTPANPTLANQSAQPEFKPRSRRVIGDDDEIGINVIKSTYRPGGTLADDDDEVEAEISHLKPTYRRGRTLADDDDEVEAEISHLKPTYRRGRTLADDDDEVEAEKVPSKSASGPVRAQGDEIESVKLKPKLTKRPGRTLGDDDE